MRPVLAALALVIALAGCGRADDRGEMRAAVERFYDAIRADRGTAACAELGASTAEQLESQSGRPCAQAVTELDYRGGPVVRVQVYALNGKVDLRGGESAFLSRESSAWKLSAIACRPDEKPRDRPFDCEVEA